jgi:hypothetical protein
MHACSAIVFGEVYMARLQVGEMQRRWLEQPATEKLLLSRPVLLLMFSLRGQYKLACNYFHPRQIRFVTFRVGRKNTETGGDSK